ncbi:MULTISPECIES: carbohydrate ABC transporter permease [Pontibacillus]|uniref:Sugar ABC transporter permease n=1 Tax=Pontibacillus chungwhensis TaxID=265426 RepID=A0ABY8UUT2_9BACI|nr:MULTISPECIES: sugar ABC transporter permease [Pontibacillus]MCD5322841.1 sugar ABC transporter permease [Pontibacillus sp. HN14]WIF96239.1 sugar ABC transporter permease [Pontibacillus chungwhensis]
MPKLARKKKDLNDRKRKLSTEGRWGFLMVSPYLLQFLVFLLFPLVASLYFSFSKYDMLNPPEWIGIENYTTLVQDPVFHKALWNTLYFTLLFVPAQTILALLLAVALNQSLKGLKFFRIAHFIPVICSWTVVLYVADAILNPRFGLANTILLKLGEKPQQWLSDEALIIPVLVAVAVWKGVGYMMIIFLAGLQNVPEDLYEAAEIEGAGIWKKFRHVTVPLISGTTFLVLVLTTITTFQSFEQIYVMTSHLGDVTSAGGPNNASMVLMLYLFQQGFSFLKMGYASAIAWVLFIILFGITMIQLKLQNKWVYYEK